ncbi:MAG: cyclic beta 1-2 glucan synthetase, partial [Pseudomonadales bacterium]|nr:cyclic beta 1-2 glucan synthetase [Pseudomonadales bacterium]
MAHAWIIFGRWLRLRRLLGRWGRAVTSRAAVGEPPLRARLFNVEQMELHGEALAHAHQLHIHRTPDRLLARLDDNEAVLANARRSLTAMVRDQVRITPAGDWLLDNYYLIEEQIRTARLHLPTNYSRELPSLASGVSAGLPRVFDLATEAIKHGDGRVDAQTMSRLIAAYQAVTPLKLGELWAIPIMLRLALIENLRRMSGLIMQDSADYRLAAEWVARLEDVAERDPKSVVLVVADMARSKLPLTGAFVSELMRGLHGRSAALAMPMSWIEQWVAHGGHGVEQLIHAESQQQAADQVSISNSIGSLRFLINMNWREFVESMSVVERTLRDDPAGIYARMNFHTRDNYRHAVELLARSGGVSEVDVARVVVGLARRADGSDPIVTHVGYYLIDDGLDESRAAIAASSAARPKRWRRPRRISLWAYLLPIALLDALFVAGLMSQMHGVELPQPVYASVVALAIIVFGELGIALVNWAATIVIGPQALPRLDFSGGIPTDARTIVVVPSMLGNHAAIDALVEALEVRFLANRDPNLQFALLTDFLDADEENLPTDAALVAHAAQRIDRLNEHYAPDSRDRFFLLHRPRRWNPREGRWLGYERKRGKLVALNELLRGRGREQFLYISGNVESLGNIQYVISLDTDTQLPRDAARGLAATLAHPLNRARLDSRRQRVVRGYAILQPTVGASMSGRQASRYARMFGSEPGI